MEVPTVQASQLMSLRQSTDTQWNPQIDYAPTQTEIFCSSDTAAGGGFAMAMAQKHGGDRPWLWVQDERSRKRSGVPYLYGLPESLRHDCHYVAADKVEDALFALEEGLKCSALSFVIGEISGDPKALGFTQSRRLAFASENYGVPLYLIRGDAERSLSAARMRWDIEAAMSLPCATNSKASGSPVWNAELFRSRLYRPSRWKLGHDDGALTIVSSANRLDMVAISGDRPLAEAGSA
ncbi:hypothetical protein QWY75_00290 [Pontixanthobacter aestiaquae]|uniref:Protein ImuA n=1 Tax=Pontixanthobacter aestiaquae TaxID=1509367 RepID=A0A844Z8V4_9SPHN|nr:hypothetical protein [Pontixanthobacter aestiaquae]MDN3644636.1 hypothetical protein [Pontixanthobacter aestiaquae]MXO84355.1 hypothetical protein [Pontixanthobacter aestiaquae]